MLRRTPGLVAAVLVSVALSIAASTTMFSAFHAVFLRPLPYRDAERLVNIKKTAGAELDPGVTIADLRFWDEYAHSFESLGSFNGYKLMTLTGVSEPANLFAASVSPELLPTLGARPLIGRSLAAHDFEEASHPVVLLGYSVWQQNLSGDPDVLRREIMLDGESYAVVGVMPPGFAFPWKGCVAWIPSRGVVTNPVNTSAEITARLKTGISQEQAEAELGRLTPALTRLYPANQRRWRVYLENLATRDTKEYRKAFLLLFSAVGFLLLIGCLNVAGLLLAKSAARRSEFAVRAALGAGRGRLVRQVLTESLVLSAAGAAFGLLLSWAGMRALVAAIPARGTAPGLEQISMNAAVLVFALVATALVGIAFGIAPALELPRFSLRPQGRSITDNRDRMRRRTGLMVAEIALSLVLLVGSGLLLRSFLRLMHTDPGFRSEHVLTAWVPAGEKAAQDTDGLIRRYDRILHTLQDLPGVSAAGLASTIQLGIMDITETFCPAGNTTERLVHFRAVSSRYFDSLGIPLRRGRVFTDADHQHAPRVAIVNEALARRFWPGQNPIGQRFTDCAADHPQYATVVGIVGDTRSFDLAASPEPELFEPYQQHLETAAGITIVLRTRGDPALLAGVLRRSIHQLYPDQVISSTTTMKTLVSQSIAQPRLYTGLAMSFAALALMLTLIGIYGVISYTTAQRTREIGIRVALGAQRRHVLAPMAASGVRALAGGVVVGLAASWALTRFMSSLVYGVTIYDPLTYVAAPIVLSAAALLACYLPARRALDVDPNVALKEE